MTKKGFIKEASSMDYDKAQESIREKMVLFTSDNTKQTRRMALARFITMTLQFLTEVIFSTDFLMVRARSLRAKEKSWLNFSKG